MELPLVIARAWDSIRETYIVGDLDGPSPEEILGREAGKWYTTVELPEDLVSIDVYVLKPKDGSSEIPGVMAFELDGKKSYYRSGIKFLEDKQFGELSAREVEELHPGSRIKVVIERLEAYTRIAPSVRAYKNNSQGVRDLVELISDGFNQVGVPKAESE